MEIADTTIVSAAGTAAERVLLVSLHDVSPLTLGECRTAVALLYEAGLRSEELTILVVPRHEGRVAVDRHPQTMAFLRRLADDGACLVMHGLTHRMPERSLTPDGILRGHLFARGQGELLRATAAQTALALEQGSSILRAAGLEEAARAFVPPAWLLSPSARQVVMDTGFEFYELFGGIVHRGRQYARRVVGWGSLSAIEAVATTAFAWGQVWLPGGDTRIAVHPADMRRPWQRRAIASAIVRMRSISKPHNYTAFLRAAASSRVNPTSECGQR